MPDNAEGFAALASVNADEPVDAETKALIDSLMVTLRPWEDPTELIGGLNAVLDSQNLVAKKAPSASAADLGLSDQHVILLIEPKVDPERVIDGTDPRELEMFDAHMAASRLMVLGPHGECHVRFVSTDENDASNLPEDDADLTADSWDLMVANVPGLLLETAHALLLVIPHTSMPLQKHMAAVIAKRLELGDKAGPETWAIEGDRLVKTLGEITMMLRALIQNVGLDYAEILVQAQRTIAQLDDQPTT